MLKGMPERHMAATMAHELAHVYLWMHGFCTLPLMVEEGLCELVKAQWLKHAVCDDLGVAAFLLHTLEKNPDPVYGAGYRKACGSLLRTGSLHALLHAIRKKRAFP